MIRRASVRFFGRSGSYPGRVSSICAGIPQAPLHDRADIALAFRKDVDKGLAVQGERHCPRDLGVVERRRAAIDDYVAVGVYRYDLASGLRSLALHVPQHRDLEEI